MEQHNRVESKIPWVYITTILAAVPVIGSLGFLIAFLHEVGYTSGFSLPVELIRLDSVTIFYNVALTLLLFCIFGLTGTVSALFVYKRERALMFMIGYVNFIFVPVFIYAAFKGYFGSSSIYVTSGLIIMQMVLITLMKRNIEDETKDENRITKSIKARLKDWPIFSILMLLAFCVLAYISGRMDHDFQRDYLTPSTNSDSVVLRIYGDNVICAPLASDITIKRSYFVIKLDTPGLILSNRKFPNYLFVETK